MQLIRQLRHLPNTDGFLFTGFTWGFERVQCSIKRGDDGIHRIVGASLSDLRGWIPA
jgi:hypothetical protein